MRCEEPPLAASHVNCPMLLLVPPSANYAPLVRGLSVTPTGYLLPRSRQSSMVTKN